MPHGLQDLISPTRDWTQAPQQWKHGVLTTGLPRNTLEEYFSIYFPNISISFFVLLISSFLAFRSEIVEYAISKFGDLRFCLIVP